MAKKFEKSLGNATDPTLLEPNWDAILECVDLIRSGEIQAKPAIAAVRKKTVHTNPHSALHALLLLDACVKNCGSKVHNEVATADCMKEFRELILESKSDKVRDKALEMLQCWAMAFVKQPAYKIVVDTHNYMKLSGVTFPPLKDPDTMYIASVAPEWVDGSECYRCRTEFSLLTRKHHCRACGQIFCDKCSSKTMELPNLGIEKSVRVCEECYEKGKDAGKPKKSVSDPKQDKATSESEKEREKKARELQQKEEEELQLALAISQSEAEAKERERKMYSMYNGESGKSNTLDDCSSIAPSETGYRGTAPSLADTELGIANDDPLAKYLNRDYWQKKTEQNSVAKVEQWETAPMATPSEGPPTPIAATLEPRQEVVHVETVVPVASPPGDDQAAAETLAFVDHLKEQVNMMDSRIRSNVARGRSIVNDSAIQALFSKLTTSHAEVLTRMAHLDSQRAYLEGLQDHLAHIGEARQAMDALREEHTKKQREQEDERRRQKQSAMQTKLEIMRQKKHEMLYNQRLVALQQFQQNEMAHRMGAYPPQQAPQMYAAFPAYGADPSQPQPYSQPQQQNYMAGVEQGHPQQSAVPPHTGYPMQQPAQSTHQGYSVPPTGHPMYGQQPQPYQGMYAPQPQAPAQNAPEHNSQYQMGGPVYGGAPPSSEYQLQQQQGHPSYAPPHPQQGYAPPHAPSSIPSQPSLAPPVEQESNLLISFD